MGLIGMFLRILGFGRHKILDVFGLTLVTLRLCG